MEIKGKILFRLNGIRKDLKICLSKLKISILNEILIGIFRRILLFYRRS